MTDIELIKYIWTLLANDITDGDVPDVKQLKLVKDEFAKRNIKMTDELFLEEE